MKNKEIYVILVESNGLANVSQEAYDSKEKAIEFIKSRMTEKEFEKNQRMQARGFISWYEFQVKNNFTDTITSYEIKVISLK